MEVSVVFYGYEDWLKLTRWLASNILGGMIDLRFLVLDSQNNLADLDLVLEDRDLFLG